jgi:hypothetical protein
MTYKPEDIKPKRYPNEKPKIYGKYWGYPSHNVEWFDYTYPCTYPWSERPIQWFIDIPDAPPELKPLKYPENKPEQDGMYMVHDVNRDIWTEAIWDGDMLSVWSSNVTHFIPIRLDKENEMPRVEYFSSGRRAGKRLILQHLRKEKENEMDENPAVKPVCQTETMSVELVDDQTVNIFIDLGEDYKGDLLVEVDDMTYLALNWLYLQGYDVTKREPEIEACPNPTCERTKFLEVIEVPSRYAHPNKAFIVECQNCGYRGGRGSSKEQSIKLHNLICEKTVVTNVANGTPCHAVTERSKG